MNLKNIFHDALECLYREVNKDKFELKMSFEKYFTAIYRNAWRYYVKINNRQILSDIFPEKDLENEPIAMLK